MRSYHALWDLSTAFFSIPLSTETQEQVTFTWNGQQWIFRVLPQGYLHSPTLSPGIIIQDLDLEKQLEDIQGCLKEQEWEISSHKITAASHSREEPLLSMDSNHKGNP
jgi:hypothetical protein